MTMTPERLAEIERVTEAATTGPWRIDVHTHMEVGCRCMSCHMGTGLVVTPPAFSCDESVNAKAVHLDGCTADLFSEPDAEFIALARTAVPELTAEVRRLRAELERFHRVGYAVNVTPRGTPVFQEDGGLRVEQDPDDGRPVYVRDGDA